MSTYRSSMFSHYLTWGRVRLLISFLLLLAYPFSGNAQDDSKHAVYGFVGGLGYGTLKNNDVQDSTFAFKPSYTKQVGMSLEVPIPLLEKKGTLYNELTLSQLEANSSFQIPDSLTINQTFVPYLLSVTNMFRYCFTKGELKYYVGVGIYNSFVVTSKNLKTTIKYKNGVPLTTESEVIPDHAVHGIMLLLSTGIAYKYGGLEIRYDPGRNYTKQIDYSVYMPTISVVLNLRINP
jgi:hypothetical protein